MSKVNEVEILSDAVSNLTLIHITDAYSVNAARAAGVIEGVLLTLGKLDKNKPFKYKDVEVSNASPLTITLPSKKIVRKENYFELMKRLAEEYIKEVSSE